MRYNVVRWYYTIKKEKMRYNEVRWYYTIKKVEDEI